MLRRLQGALALSTCALAALAPATVTGDLGPWTGGTCEVGPDAWVSGFSVLDGVAQWRAFHEADTKEYLLQEHHAGEWHTVRVVPPNGGTYEIAVSEPGPFRLVEQESSGRQLIWGRTTRVPAPTKTQSSSAEPPRSRDWRPQFRPPRAPQEMEDYVVFVPDDTPFGDLIEFYIDRDLIPLLSTEYNVIKERMSSFPDYTQVWARRDAVDAKIESHAAQGVRLFHLVGTSTDYWYLDGPFTELYWPPDWATQHASLLDLTVDRVVPEDLAYQDLIPTFVYPTSDLNPETSMEVTRPYYFTDQPYADVDGDEVPDVVVTRWPVRTGPEVKKLIEKMAAYNDPTSWGTETSFSALYLVNDEQFQVAGDGGLALSGALRTMEHLPDGLEELIVLGSEHNGPYEWYQAALEKWNDPMDLYSPVEILVFMGSRSGRLEPTGFFSKFFVPYSLLFDVNADLSSQDVVLGVAASCGGADFVSEQWWDAGFGYNFGDSIGEDFLVHANGVGGKGAIAWIGPTGGSWQRANEVIVREFLKVVFSDPRSIAESWLSVIQHLYQEYADDEAVLHTLRSYAFLGDPVSRMNPTHHDPVFAPTVRGPVADVQVYPNPIGNSGWIEYSVPVPSTVTIRIYDVAGRVVRELESGWVTKLGRRRTAWNLEGPNGAVASGVYFYTVDVGEHRRTGKMTVLK